MATMSYIRVIVELSGGFSSGWLNGSRLRPCNHAAEKGTFHCRDSEYFARTGFASDLHGYLLP